MTINSASCPKCKKLIYLSDERYPGVPVIEEDDDDEVYVPKLVKKSTYKKAIYVTEPPGLGLSKYWKLPDSHPFYIPSVKHDCRYSMRMAHYLNGDKFETSCHADKMFLDDCMKVVSDMAWEGENAVWYTAEANMFHWIISGIGKYRWPKPLEDTDAVKAELENVFKCLDILKAAGETNVSITMFNNVESI